MIESNPCIRAFGPKDAKIALVGEAPGAEEEKVGLPFVGYSGNELRQMCTEAGIDFNKTYRTNVLWTRPPLNKIESFYVKRESLPSTYPFGPVASGKYLSPVFIPEVNRLYEELKTLRPNIVIALGNVACWALLATTGISKIRGTTAASSPLGGIKVFPTFHPASVLRNWEQRVIVVADLMKALRESAFPEVRRPQRFVTINPSLEEIRDWYFRYALGAAAIGVDVETRNGHITIAGFASSPKHAIVIPLADLRQQDSCYWRTLEDEIEARRWIQKFLLLPQPKIFQNGMYDIQYFLREDFKLHNCLEDTMLQHHAIFPELPKSLGFLGSIYTDEPAWKLMRPRAKEADQLKKDE